MEGVNRTFVALASLQRKEMSNYEFEMQHFYNENRLNFSFAHHNKEYCNVTSLIYYCTSGLGSKFIEMKL